MIVGFVNKYYNSQALSLNNAFPRVIFPIYYVKCSSSVTVLIVSVWPPRPHPCSAPLTAPLSAREAADRHQLPALSLSDLCSSISSQQPALTRHHRVMSAPGA